MVTNSDLLIWQEAVKGINESGKTDLIGEEWSALTKLNGCLSNGNFQSNESHRSIMLLKDNLNRYSNNPVLQINMKNFIALCEKYYLIQVSPIGTTSTNVNRTNQTSIGGKSKSSGISSLQIVIIIVIILAAGYFLVKDTSWFKNIFSGGRGKPEQVEVVEKIPEEVTLITDNSGQTTNMDAITNDKGVVINGVCWATCNVDDPGAFAASPESRGKFYQWNRRRAWTVSGEVTGWDNSTSPIGNIWETANDPCPVGWRIPTWKEIQTLLVKERVTYEWVNQNSINGLNVKDVSSGNSIFFPAVGRRDGNNGSLVNYSSYGYYWSSTKSVNSTDKYSNAYYLSFSVDNNNPKYGAFNRSDALNIRCVATSKAQSATYSMSTSTVSSIPGRFPQASERFLTASDLQYLSKEELKIMRNEIFARHGYIFQTQVMKTYFQNQSWYSPQHSNVNSLLTNIEQKNIALIQSYE